jgi:hypothetical protein
MNLSHYEPLDPHRDRGNGKECSEAGCEPLPTDDPAAILLLEPDQRALGLEARDLLLDRPPPQRLGLPDPRGDLHPDPPVPELLAPGVGIVPVVRRDDLQAFAGAPPLAGLEADRIPQGEHLGALVTVRRRRTGGQGHPRAIGEPVDEHACTCAAPGDPLTAACARGKRAVDGPVLPLKHAVFLGQPENPGSPRSQGAIGLPTLQPPMRRTF